MNREGFNPSAQPETPIESIKFFDESETQSPVHEKVPSESFVVRRLRELRELEGKTISRLGRSGRLQEALALQTAHNEESTPEGLKKVQDQLLVQVDKALTEIAKRDKRFLGSGDAYYVFSQATKEEVERWVLDLLDGFEKADPPRQSAIIQGLRGMEKLVRPEHFYDATTQAFPDLNINLDDSKWDVVVPVSQVEKPSFFRRIFGGGN